MKKQIFAFALLLFMLAISGISGAINLSSFVLASLIITFSITLRLKLIPEWRLFGINKIAYFFWLAKEICMSSISMTQLIWDPMHKLKPAYGRVPALQATELGKALYANSITLTPGTIAIDLEDGEILVHAMQESGFDDLKQGVMANRILRLGL